MLHGLGYCISQTVSKWCYYFREKTGLFEISHVLKDSNSLSVMEYNVTQEEGCGYDSGAIWRVVHADK